MVAEGLPIEPGHRPSLYLLRQRVRVDRAHVRATPPTAMPTSPLTELPKCLRVDCILALVQGANARSLVARNEPNRDSAERTSQAD
jgi:hypothetical protein